MRMDKEALKVTTGALGEDPDWELLPPDARTVQRKFKDFSGFWSWIERSLQSGQKPTVVLQFSDQTGVIHTEILEILVNDGSFYETTVDVGGDYQ